MYVTSWQFFFVEKLIILDWAIVLLNPGFHALTTFSENDSGVMRSIDFLNLRRSKMVLIKSSAAVAGLPVSALSPRFRLLPHDAH